MFRSKAMHHDRKTLEFEADSDSNNVTLDNREHFALKNLGSGVQATISAIGNRKIRTRWNATKSVANALTTVGIKRTVAGPFFPSLFPNFLHNAPYKIILFCHRLGREISWKGTLSGIQRLTKKFILLFYRGSSYIHRTYMWTVLSIAVCSCRVSFLNAGAYLPAQVKKE